MLMYVVQVLSDRYGFAASDAQVAFRQFTLDAFNSLLEEEPVGIVVGGEIARRDVHTNPTFPSSALQASTSNDFTTRYCQGNEQPTNQWLKPGQMLYPPFQEDRFGNPAASGDDTVYEQNLEQSAVDTAKRFACQYEDCTKAYAKKSDLKRHKTCHPYSQHPEWLCGCCFNKGDSPYKSSRKDHLL